MATDWSVNFVNQYRANIDILMQQQDARVAATVRQESQVGEYAYYEQLPKISVADLTAVSSRNAATSYSDLAPARRRVGLEFFPYSVLIDNPDKVRMLVNPDNTVAQNIAYLFNRKKDALLLTCASGIAYTGKNGGTSTTFTAGMVIPVSGSGTNSEWSGSTSTLNIDKLVGAGYLLDAQDAPMGDRHFIGNPFQKADLLKTTQVTSADYNTVKALVRGEIDSFMGFKFTWTNLVTKIGSTYPCYAWHKSAMLLSIGLDDMGFNARIVENQDYNFATHIHNQMMVGCTRMDENMIVKVECLDTP